MKLERSEVQWGETRIVYGIRRSKRRRTVGLTVASPGAVTLTAPAGTPVALLDKVVRAKARWITTRLRWIRDAEAALAPREFVSGESFLYLGRQYRLAISRGPEANVALERGRFRITLPATAAAKSRSDAVRTALIDWYIERAMERIWDRVIWWAPKIGVRVPTVSVRHQRKRWGSCSRGVVRFNWRIVQAPLRLLDYVVVHELVHLLHPNHQIEFWTTVGRVLPDYEVRREELRRIGPRLDW